MSEPPSDSTPSSRYYFKYTTVTGYFLQDEPDTDPGNFDYASTNFGLINRSYDTDVQPIHTRFVTTAVDTAPSNDGEPATKLTQWERFVHKVRTLNRQEALNGRPVRYKVLFLGRHGEGYHNVAESFYGTTMWDCYWALKDGNDTITWADAHLTAKGEAQARVARSTWVNSGISSLPEAFYVSPLNRCLATASITFDGISPNGDKEGKEPFRPLVKELLRETLGIHTCDRRSSKYVIEKEYPNYRLEPGFAENDLLWDPHLRESGSACAARLRKLLDDILSSIFVSNTNDGDAEEVIKEPTFLSLTSHSGAITAILEVLHHQPFPLATGAVIPVLVKAERVPGSPPPEPVDPPTLAPACPGPSPLWRSQS